MKAIIKYVVKRSILLKESEEEKDQMKENQMSKRVLATLLTTKKV